MLLDVQSQIQSWWAPALAFAAGLVSFGSPCVLPLVPGYLAFVTGQAPRRIIAPAAAMAGGSSGGIAVSTAARREPAAAPIRPSWRTSLLPILAFIAGFTVLFTVVFGFTASALSRWILSPVGQRVAGGLVFVFGAFMLLYALRLRLPWLYREERPFLARLGAMHPGPGWAFPLGMAFAAGWTPCIGPVLGAIYGLASVQGSTGRAVLLLLMYSLGLGLPFLLIGLGVERVMGAMRVFSRHYTWFAGVSGVVLMAIGFLLITDLWVRVMAPVLTRVNRFTPPI
jgi:cytochrome c-type biogenesis protein